MNRELLMLVDAISREKTVEREVVFAAVEAARQGMTAALVALMGEEYPQDEMVNALVTMTGK